MISILFCIDLLSPGDNRLRIQLCAFTHHHCFVCAGAGTKACSADSKLKVQSRVKDLSRELRSKDDELDDVRHKLEYVKSEKRKGERTLSEVGCVARFGGLLLADVGFVVVVVVDLPLTPEDDPKKR